MSSHNPIPDSDAGPKPVIAPEENPFHQGPCDLHRPTSARSLLCSCIMHLALHLGPSPPPPRSPPPTASRPTWPPGDGRFRDGGHVLWSAEDIHHIYRFGDIFQPTIRVLPQSLLNGRVDGENLGAPPLEISRHPMAIPPWPTPARVNPGLSDSPTTAIFLAPFNISFISSSVGFCIVLLLHL